MTCKAEYREKLILCEACHHSPDIPECRWRALHIFSCDFVPGMELFPRDEKVGKSSFYFQGTFGAGI